MDPLCNLRDAIRCHLCETPDPSKICDTCQVHLCEVCEEDHVSDESKEHKMVSFQTWRPTLMCPKHSTKMCELHCEQCNIPLCSLCAVSRLFQLESATEEEDLIQESSPLRPLLDVPHILADISTGQIPLYGVSCLSDEEIWTRGNDNIMKLYNIQGELIRSVQTKSRNIPWDIAVTRYGDLAYTDYWNRSIDLVSDTQIHQLVKLWGWRPRCVCNTSYGNLLVIMDSDDYKQTKVVRYIGNTEKQSIQWDHRGQPLYSSDTYTKYLCENRNLDICVSDCAARAIVVVSVAGIFRFRYTGPLSTTAVSFSPLGITTDSQGKILTADSNSKCIHVVNEDGHFIRFIENCGLHDPRGLCVDSRDNLIVAETCKLKKIQYYT